MNVDLIQELVNELTSSLEDIETQQRALFQFLKDRGDFTDEQFTAYLSQAGKASGVRWRAVRVRLDHLIEGEKTREEKAAEAEKEKNKEKPASGGEQAAETVEAKEGPLEEGQTDESKKDEESDPKDEGKNEASSQPVKVTAQPDKDKASSKDKASTKDGAGAADQDAGQGSGTQTNPARDKK